MILIVLGLYFSVSLFFFIFPTLIWGKKKYKNTQLTKMLQSNKILNIAHRGGPRHGTQNTIQTFQKTKNSTNCFQMDVCETADKILIVHHDHHLKRTCSVDKDVEQYNFIDLPCFGEQIVLDFGFRQKRKSNKQKIPKLQQVFKKFPNTILNIQLKTPTETAITQFIKLMHEHNRIQNTIIGTRNNKNVQIKRKNPQILNFMNDAKVHLLILSYLTGFVPFLKIQQSSLQVPVYSTQYYNWDIDRTPQENRWKVKRFMIMVRILNVVCRPLMWHLKRRGVISIGWVCNTRQAFDNAIKGGFQGIMTDDPLLLSEYLKQKGLSIDD